MTVEAGSPESTPDRLLQVSCPVCGSERSTDLAEESGIAIARCAACSVVFTRTPPRDSQSHYAIPEHQMEAKYERILSGLAEHPRTPNYHEHLALLESLTSGRNLLDIGSHCGFFLNVARGRGWDVVGVEPSPASAKLARERFGLDVRTGTLSEADVPSAAFDAVTLVDVFEHIADPCQLLEEIAYALRPGGRLFVKVPNFRYIAAKQRVLSRFVDEVFDAKEHLVHYTPATLTRTLQTCGYEIEVVRVPLPIQAGGRLRRAVRAAGPAIARRIPRGVDLPLATDIAVVARSWRTAT